MAFRRGIKLINPNGGTIFYDGACGLCHGFVRFVLARDKMARFRFAPLEGKTFASLTARHPRLIEANSVILARADGDFLFKSRAVFAILKRLGGAWRLAALAVEWVPPTISNGVYNGVALLRRRLFAKPAQACPHVASHLKERFIQDEI